MRRLAARQQVPWERECVGCKARKRGSSRGGESPDLEAARLASGNQAVLRSLESLRERQPQPRASSFRPNPQGRLQRQPRGRTRVSEPGTRQIPWWLRTFGWPRFITSGSSVCAPGVTLGKNPGGQFLNAMELLFTERPAAGERRRRLARGGYSSYRVRQTLAEDVWENVGGRWFLLSRTPAGTLDDPDPELQCWNPPELRTVDTPGWSAYHGVGPSTRQFVVGEGRRTSVNATIVWVQQNFYTWAEGERTFVGGWQRVSVRFPWHNSLRLERASPTADWRSAAETRIQSGHMEFGPNPETETR